MDKKSNLFEQLIQYFHDGSWLEKMEPFLINLVIAVLIYLMGSWITQLMVKTFNKLMTARKVDLALQQFLTAICTAAFKFIVVIIAINQLGINTTSLLALLGAAGLAVGLALKDSLSNFASGVMLILNRPFKIGDFVEAANVKGIIEKITVFNTVIATVDNKAVFIPNAQIHQGSIINYSAKPTRRVDLVIGISYTDNIKQARDLMNSIIIQDGRILKDPPHVIAVDELGESSVNFVVRVWVKSEDYWDVKWKLLETIKICFDENSISIPFPQRDIHLHQSSEYSYLPNI